ncbi:MAG: WD40/YVTN/BNR-like repeat-containing protein [Candidatus Sulfotelmatobacter sp.]
MKSRGKLYIPGIALLLVLSCLRLNAANWLPFGPDGGDARSFAVDPHDRGHLYLGTLTGWIYESRNGGADWKRLAWVGKRNDLALDSIVVDNANSKHLLVGAWVLGSAAGGLYSSEDGGVNWESNAEMRGQSIRALEAAASDPKIVVAGTLKGVYRSTDGGEHWQLISPEGSQEIHEVESVAIDPANPQVIYAGTWHLPWKTIDGGANWTSIKQGIIEDSDVFSIIVDPKDSSVVYASACSGIYKSQSAGEKFQKVQGIPSTARRTRVLMQDPQNLNVVFAGTTEGLYRTGDSGEVWQRTTGPEVIVNDVFIDPANTNRILLATDRGGVLASNDGGYSFAPSNNGFSARQITSYVGDATQPATIYVGVVNDKAWGGVFVSENGGLSWSQRSAGLNGQDVFSLAQASDGTVLAGTGHGIYRLQGDLWTRVNNVSLSERQEAQPAAAKAEVKAEKVVARPGKHAAKPRTVPAKKPTAPAAAPAHVFDANVNAIARVGDTLYAATSEGLLCSGTAGESWKLMAGPEKDDWSFVASAKSWVLAATLRSAVLSSDGGQKWSQVSLPETLTQLAAIAVDDSGGLWVGGREGIFISQDRGATWQGLKNFAIRDVNSLFYDEPSQRMLITANSQNTIAFEVHLPDRSVHYWNTGWNLRLVRPVGDHLVGATLFDGIVVQPRMVDSSEVARDGGTNGGR